MYYYVFSDLGNSLCLDINISNQVVVNTQDLTSQTQLWQPVALVDNQTDYGVVLLNKATEQVIWASAASAVLEMISIPSNWTNYWIGWDLAGGGALQLNANTTLNMNVQGGQPISGSTVIADTWQGGKNDETWQLQPADF